MSVLATNYPTMLDVAKRLDPDGKLANVAEILNKQNDMIADGPAVEGNLPTGNKTTQRTGIPEPTWRKFNAGVQPTKSHTAQVEDRCGMLEAYSEVDVALANMGGNAAAFRATEDKAIVEGFGQKVAETAIYGNDNTLPESFLGLAPRFNTRSLAAAQTAQNVIHAGGSGSTNTSIWLIGWDPDKVAFIYPKGSKAGLDQRDMGEVTLESAPGGGGKMQAYRTHFRWDVGLMVRDWRYVVRIANIDVNALTKDGSSGADLFDCIAQALEQIHSLSNCTPRFYCNRTIGGYLRRQQKHVKNVQISMADAAGRHVLMLNEVPLRRSDALLNTEATVPNS